MLAFEPKEDGIMLRPPRDPHEPLLTGALVIRILLVSALLVGGTWWLYEWERDNGASIASPWVPSVAKGTLGSRSIVNFSSNAIIGPGALSARARAVLGADAAQAPTTTTAPAAGTGTPR